MDRRRWEVFTLSATETVSPLTLRTNITDCVFTCPPEPSPSPSVSPIDTQCCRAAATGHHGPESPVGVSDHTSLGTKSVHKPTLGDFVGISTNAICRTLETH